MAFVLVPVLFLGVGFVVLDFMRIIPVFVIAILVLELVFVLVFIIALAIVLVLVFLVFVFVLRWAQGGKERPGKHSSFNAGTRPLRGHWGVTKVRPIR